ncbi:MAG: hypothetical protein D8M58_17580 [Calditrichaeota bacterium]|nr:MAG: hypothetical protein DWQ03_01495 [Calditrichota bacterium]MBL1207218.1 hypothetical protein [Calditrichota bacterium]NOG47051.1 hypothetical protein [Calditrichota bacterium]
MKQLSIIPVAYTTTIFLIITYVLCILFDFVFPQWSMSKIWETVLPGFSWISWSSFLIGLVGTVGYGVYTAVVFVPIYNFFHKDKLES